MRSLLRLLKKYNHVLIFIILEIIALILLSNHNAYQGSKLVNANREISGRIYDMADGSREYLSLRKNNDALVKENTRLRNLVDSLIYLPKDSLLADSSAALGSIDSTSLSPRYLYSEARIVRSSVTRQMNYLTIDKGKKQGMEKDMAVICDEGIVGIILECSQNYSTVIPVINLNFRLSVKVKHNNYAGILQWDGKSPGEALLNEIPYHAEINKGDSIVTSGFSAIFPEGLYVGTIKEFNLKEGNFYDIIVDLGTDYQRLFHVNIVKNFFQQEQRLLEEKTEK